MGSLNLAYPKRTEGSVQEQLAALQRSMRDIIDQLNLADWSAEAILQEISTGINEDAALRTEEEKKQSAFASLKQLIIKTADFSMENSEQFTKTLQGGYVAKSTFGEYAEATSATIKINSKGITQLFDYTAGINSKDERYGVTSRQYVKTGLLFHDENAQPVYGVGVGNISTKTELNGEVIDETQGEVVTVTPGRISFWQQGLEVAYLSGKKLHFPSGTLEASGAVLTGTLTAAAGSKLGPWNVTESSIWYGKSSYGAEGGLYFGTSGLSIGTKCKVDANGVMSLNALKFGNVDVYDALLDLNEKVDELMAYAGMIDVTGKKINDLILLVDGDGLSIGSASTGAYAVVLNSGAAMRITAKGGDLFISNAGARSDCWIKLDTGGKISFSADTVDFNFVNNIVGLPTG